MFKAILLFLLLFGAALYFPQTKPVVLDVLAPVLNPGLAWHSRSEMKRILRDLRSINQRGREIPARGREFLAWMEKEFPGASGEDAWGTDYTLKTWADSVGLVSNGPDLEVNTEDDLLETVSIERLRRR